MPLPRTDLALAVRPSGRQDDRLQTVARAARAMDHGVLRSVFFDLLGRPPFAAEYERWLGVGLPELLDQLLGSDEFWEHWWEEQLYYFLLIDTFRPETASIRSVPGKLSEGRMSVRDAIHRIALSSSFDQRNPGADTFVTVVMEQMCGITVQNTKRELEIGKTAYNGGTGRFLGHTAENQSDVVRICVEHKRAAQHMIAREYERLLRGPGEKSPLAGWARRLHKDSYAFLSIVREWFLSEAYLARLAEHASKSNRLYIRGLFVDLAGRLPREDEMEPMRYALDGLADSRPLRSVLVRLLLDSGTAEVPKKSEIDDPTAWIGGEFERLLGRRASEQELATFTSVFHEPECRPETILYALLSHAEYQQY